MQPTPEKILLLRSSDSGASVLPAPRCVQLACGAMHTIAVTEEGEVWSWGKGDSGQLGLAYSHLTEHHCSLSPQRVEDAFVDATQMRIR